MIGPVQLIVLGFDRPSFLYRVRDELTRLRESGLIRLADALVIHKDVTGKVSSTHTSDLGTEAASEYGAIIGGLVGLGATGEQSVEDAAHTGARMFSSENIHLLDLAPIEVLDAIPADSEAMVLLIEHRWAIPLREAVSEENGAALVDFWIHPQGLVAAGYLASAEA
jgi:uncharacterized membrane protein